VQQELFNLHCLMQHRQKQQEVAVHSHLLEATEHIELQHPAHCVEAAMRRNRKETAAAAAHLS